MPTNTLSLEPGGPKRLKISWSGIWKNFNVELDGRSIGVIDGGMSALKAGHEFPLGDGTTLKIQLTTGFTSELLILRDGLPLPGSASDPEQRFKLAWSMIFVVAGLNAAIGIVAMVFDVRLLRELGAGAATVFIGVVYAALGLCVRAGRSRAALALTIGIYALDGLVSLIMSKSGSGAIMRILFLIPMYRGFDAIAAMEKPPRAPAAASRRRVASTSAETSRRSAFRP